MAVGVGARKRYLILDCEDAEKWRGHEKLYLRTFGSGGETWEHFKAYDLQFPPDEEFGEIAAVVVSGSHHDAWGNAEWVVASADFCKRAAEAGIRMLGICFGCQLLARALGGRVGHNPCNRFILGTEQIFPSEALLARQDFQEAVESSSSKDVNLEEVRRVAALPPDPDAFARPRCSSSSAYLHVLESHGDQVLELPQGSALLASSIDTRVEMWSVSEGNMNVLASQFHPELWAGLIEEKIVPCILRKGKMTQEEVDLAKESMAKHPTNSSIIVGMMRRFLGTSNKVGSGKSELVQPSVKLEKQMSSMFTAVGDALHAEMMLIRKDYDVVKSMNELATVKYNDMADFATGLSQFATRLSAKNTEFGPFVSQVDEMEQQLTDLEAVVSQLDTCTERLETKVRHLQALST